MSFSTLQNLGISDTESSVYQLLLKLGESPAWQIVKESGLKRPTVYTTLGSLEKKGLVLKQDKNKIIHFTPVSPTELLTLAENRYEQLQRTRQDLQTILPSLLSSYTLSMEKPIVQTYEGVKGLKKIYEHMLQEGKPIYAILQAASVDPTLYDWLTTTFVKKRIQAKIHVKAIVASSTASKDYHKKDIQEFRISHMVPAETFPFEHEVDIYGDTVAFIYYKKDNPLIGITIHHPAIAKTMKAIFDLAWIGSQAAVV